MGNTHRRVRNIAERTALIPNTTGTYLIVSFRNSINFTRFHNEYTFDISNSIDGKKAVYKESTVGAITIIPWQLYLFYGGKRPLIDNYDAMKSYMQLLERKFPSGLCKWGLGDWFPI
jgi:hypothetical protein